MKTRLASWNLTASIVGILDVGQRNAQSPREEVVKFSRHDPQGLTRKKPIRMRSANGNKGGKGNTLGDVKESLDNE